VPDTGIPDGQIVLLAGSTGMLGGRIAHHLLDQPGTALRLLVRPGGPADPTKKETLHRLEERGAVVVDGDVSDPASLDAATRGVDVVVSALQGGPDVIIDGQVALAHAARRNGARRMVPSDFALDIFTAPPGEHPFFDWRRSADEAIAATGLEHVHVLNGAFLDGFAGSLFDHETRTVTYWGTGDELIEATTVEDTARYTARAALDRELPSGKFGVVGSRVSAALMADRVEQLTGRRYTRNSLGAADQLRSRIADAHRRGAELPMWIADVYWLFMITGVTAVLDPQNDRYPEITPEPFDDIVRATLPPRRREVHHVAPPAFRPPDHREGSDLDRRPGRPAGWGGGGLERDPRAQPELAAARQVPQRPDPRFRLRARRAEPVAALAARPPAALRAAVGDAAGRALLGGSGPGDPRPRNLAGRPGVRRQPTADRRYPGQPAHWPRTVM
jgi:uncharacterized protein YbjT (DUF2867 family)